MTALIVMHTNTHTHTDTDTDTDMHMRVHAHHDMHTTNALITSSGEFVACAGVRLTLVLELPLEVGNGAAQRCNLHSADAHTHTVIS